MRLIQWMVLLERLYFWAEWTGRKSCIHSSWMDSSIAVVSNVGCGRGVLDECWSTREISSRGTNSCPVGYRVEQATVELTGIVCKWTRHRTAPGAAGFRHAGIQPEKNSLTKGLSAPSTG